MKKLFVFVLAVVSLFGCGRGPVQNPVLSIEGGNVQGVLGENEGVYVYKGIPYAAAPINDLRWKAPQPVVPWDGVLMADKFGHPAYQAVHYPGGYTTEWGYGDEAPYSEDCLYLNVYTKAPGQTGKKLPVAVWIFGGGLREGWGSEPEFYGEEWAKKDVVLVTFNYRVGVFGFLTHPELSAESPDHVSGNYGILDQIQVLKWVKNNIAQFGGDPDNVMIFGQSAGARSTKTLCASPLTKGLFSKAVIMSGSGLTTAPAGMSGVQGTGIAPANAPKGAASGVAAKRPTMQAGMPMGGFAQLTLAESEKQTKEVMDWAGFTSLEKMRKASTEMMFTVGNMYQAVTGKRSPLTASPISPAIDGYVLPESFDDAALDNTLAHVSYMIGYTLNDAGNMAPGIVDFCLNRENVGDKAYAYQFARPLPTDGRANVLQGAFHSSDLWYVFKSLKNCWRPWTQGDWDLSEKMLTAWSNFAKYGDPNGLEAEVWTPYTKANPKFMVFKLDANDAEDSAMGDPLVAPRPVRR